MIKDPTAEWKLILEIHLTGENGKDLVNKRIGIAKVGRMQIRKGKENEFKLIYGIHGVNLTIVRREKTEKMEEREIKEISSPKNVR